MNLLLKKTKRTLNEPGIAVDFMPRLESLTVGENLAEPHIFRHNTTIVCSPTAGICPGLLFKPNFDFLGVSSSPY